MSFEAGVQIGGSPAEGFTIKNIGGCRIVFGQIPLSDFAMLTHGFSKKALMDSGIADRIGATLVIGEPADLDQLRQMDLPVSEARHRDYLAATELGLHKVAMWLRTGERGASSNAMCQRIFGVPREGKMTSHPLDPSDLRRCLAFLDATDARDKVGLMVDVSPQWAALVSNWDDLLATFMEEEAGKKAPKTYEFMGRIFETVEQ